jgi:hypothetical protein
MKIVLRVLGGLGAFLALAVVLIFVAGRFADGPMGFFSGGPFASGEAASAPEDWSFATDANTIEMQLLEPARSRTVWVVVEDGSAYIPCGIPNFRLWKQWPHEARTDGRAEIRLEGRRYPVTLVKTEGRELFDRLLGLVGGKYGSVPPGEVSEDDIWFFRLEPRTAS